jgi:hypothetical protein
MKKIIASIFMVAVILFMVSCEKETEGISHITYFADFDFQGESVILHTLGTPYTDPSVTASESGNALEVKVLVTSEMNGYSGDAVQSDVADKYTITYSAVNSDGYPGSITRTVFVVPPSGDFVTSIAGMYTASVQRAPAFTPSAQYNDLEYIFITKTGDNTFAISDAIGGYYYIGRGYGYDYAAQGSEITVNDLSANDFTITGSEIPGFGNTVEVTDFKVDAATKQITFTGTGNFANGEFRIQLKLVE